ncbi:9436_t:CDS:2 [Paraglomus brasilianum]|uniref:9436_t:CDS:1 n=1 Tax=Paraglomus brasilianum TaxID=144538 RepID=A0A9N9D564_9GLOM|nr:9436_t:CDS:2 [Paraglomus brasilianum]
MDSFQEIIFNQDPTIELKHLAWLLEPPTGVMLGMTAEELLAPSKRNKSKPTPPRPQQSYILFRKNFKALHPPMKFEDVSKRSMNEWRNASPVVKEYFEMLSSEAKKRHALNPQILHIDPMTTAGIDFYSDFTITDQFIHLSDIYCCTSTFPTTGQAFESSPVSATTSEELVTQDDDGFFSYFNFESYNDDGTAN